MKLFIDSGDPREIREAHEWGIIDGVTTNPSLAGQTGRPYKDVILEILSIINGPVSLQVVSDRLDQMIEQGKKLAGLHENVVVKVPATKEGIQAGQALLKEGIKVNVTLVFSVNQALLAGKIGVTYCSPFVGRIDDIGQDGNQVIEEIRQVYDTYQFETKILYASVRHPKHVREAALLGCDIATVPYGVLEKLYQHSLTTQGLKKFLDDWFGAGLRLPWEEK
ncbi:MAG TPA: fructose-6-phosphate aldolase [Patescibacteria group bacterium]|nr:fructose-6-phosphate aldolase [Patescibacteria group bacterium]